MRRLLALLLLALLAPPAPAVAQTDEICFATGHCLSGRFRAFWEENGGLPVFGMPITTARPEANRETGRTHLTQWLERARFELHPDNPPPGDVQLGRLGDDRLRQNGLAWAPPPRDDTPPGDCRLFGETGHRLCDQAGGLGFRQYWESHGLDLGDPGVSDREALALFGLPLTRAREQMKSGQRVLTQWFERARFEWHPDKPDEFKVLLGLLGWEVSQDPPPTYAEHREPFGPITVEAGGQRVVRRVAAAYWGGRSVPADPFLPAEGLSVAVGDPIGIEFATDPAAGGEGYRGPLAVTIFVFTTSVEGYSPDHASGLSQACLVNVASQRAVRAGQRATITATLAPGEYAVCFVVNVNATAADSAAAGHEGRVTGSGMYAFRLSVREAAPDPAPAAACAELLSPARRAVLDNGRTDQRDNIVWEFDWSDCPGATAYGLYVIGPAAAIPVVDLALPTSTYRQVARAYIVERNRRGWTWRVRAWVNGQWGAWTEARPFDVEPMDTDAPPS